MVKIRFSRIGKKDSPYFRLVATDARNKRDGESLDILGTYDPVKKQIIQFNEERVNEWIKNGAQCTDSAMRMIKLHAKQAKVAAK